MYINYRIEGTKKLSVIFLRASGLTDNDVHYISNFLKTNTTVKILDISSNPKLTSNSITSICEIFQTNRALEYLGLSKLNLSTK